MSIPVIRGFLRLVRPGLAAGLLIPSAAAAQTESINFDQLERGLITSQVFGSEGSGPVLVRGGFCQLTGGDVAPFECTPDSPENRAVIFDTAEPGTTFACPGGGIYRPDFDLGSPNQQCPDIPALGIDCPGDCPGSGTGGVPGALASDGTPAENCFPLGNVIIIAERDDSCLGDTLVDQNNDGIVDIDPDDADELGAFMEFDFSAIGPVLVLGIDVVDVEGAGGDEEGAATVEFFDVNGDPIGDPGNAGMPYELPQVGDNGRGRFRFCPTGCPPGEEGVSGVSRMRVKLRGSGAIDNLFFLVDGSPRYDLALRKTLGTSQATQVPEGATVTFDVTVFNQGTRNATFLQLGDYIDPTLWETFDTADNPAGTVLTSSGSVINYSWAASAEGARLTTIGTLRPTFSFTVPITLTVAEGVVGEVCNGSEIWADDGDEEDFDSQPESEGDDDIGDTDPLIDDEILDDGTLDEDDHDIACVAVGVEGTYDLALTKSCVTGSVSPLADATLRLTITNEGELPASAVQVVDYLDTNAFSFDLAKNGPGTTTGSANLGYSWNDGGGDPVLTLNGTLASGEFAVVDMVLTATENPPESLSNIAEILTDDGDDIDSAPESEQENLADDFGQEDDISQATCLVTAEADLAVRKRVLSSPAELVAGAAVTFEIEVFNQGSLPAQELRLVDYVNVAHSSIPLISDWWEPFNVADNPPGVSSGDKVLDYTWTLSGSNGVATITGTPTTLDPGESVTLPVTLRVATGAPDVLYNFVEILSDDPPTGGAFSDRDSEPESEENDGNTDLLIDDEIFDDGTLDEDDHDVASVGVPTIPIPAATPIGLIVLSLLLLGVGVFWVNRL